MKFENLEVEIFPNRTLLGKKAAEEVELSIKSGKGHSEEVEDNIISFRGNNVGISIDFPPIYIGLLFCPNTTIE